MLSPIDKQHIIAQRSVEKESKLKQCVDVIDNIFVRRGQISPIILQIGGLILVLWNKQWIVLYIIISDIAKELSNSDRSDILQLYMMGRSIVDGVVYKYLFGSYASVYQLVDMIVLMKTEKRLNERWPLKLILVVMIVIMDGGIMKQKEEYANIISIILLLILGMEIINKGRLYMAVACIINVYRSKWGLTVLSVEMEVMRMTKRSRNLLTPLILMGLLMINNEDILFIIYVMNNMNEMSLLLKKPIFRLQKTIYCNKIEKDEYKRYHKWGYKIIKGKSEELPSDELIKRNRIDIIIMK